MSSLIIVAIMGLYCCSMETKASSLGLPVLYGPNVATLGDIVSFQCKLLTYPEREPILLQLFKHGDRTKVLSEYTSLNGELASFPLIIKSSSEGMLECVASAQNNSLIQPTVSSPHYLKVVEASSLGLPVLYGPNVATLGDIVSFQCKLLTYPEREPILLQLFKHGDRTKVLSEYTSLNGELASFPLIIKSSSEGMLECVASAQNNSLIQPTVSSPHYLKVVEPVELVVQSGEVEFFEGKTLALLCKVKSGNHIYSWAVNGQPLSASRFHYFENNTLLIYRATPQHSGYYTCIGTSPLNDTVVYNASSPEVLITVKELVSNPDISFTVLKDNSKNYSALVTCQSTRGTLPITFSLDNRGTLSNVTVEEKFTIFNVPLVLNCHLCWLQCQAENGGRVAYSKWMALEVVSVDGPVTMHFEYALNEDFSVTEMRMHCKAAKGSHPCYQWFLNGTLIEDQNSHYSMLHQPPEESILFFSVDRSSSGTYHCQVSDSFDNTTVFKSEKRFIDKQVLNSLSVVVVLVVFGCFIFLLSCVFICCCFGAIFRRSQKGDRAEFSLEKRSSIVFSYEDELDLEEYRENPVDMNMAATMNYSDQGSIASNDEWSIDEKTLDNAPVKELNTEG